MGRNDDGGDHFHQTLFVLSFQHHKPNYSAGGGCCVGSSPNRLLHSMRCLENLSSGLKRAGWAESAALSPLYFFFFFFFVVDVFFFLSWSSLMVSRMD